MALINSTTIRLSDEKLSFYEAEAAAKNLPLRKYLRDRLEMGDNIIEEIAVLRRELQYLSELIESNSKANDRDNNNNILIEILLLFRQIAQPQKVQLAQSELKRLGFDVWTSQSQKENKENKTNKDTDYKEDNYGF